MPTIEGFGDEVIYTMMVVAAIILMTACWLTTQLRFIPFVNLLIVEYMQDFVDTNVAHSDIVAPVTQEVPVEATPPREEVPQTSERRASTESLGNQAEASKNDSEASATGNVQQEDTEKTSTEGSQEEPSENNRDLNSSEIQDAAESSSSSENRTADNVAFLETQITARKVNIKLIYMNNTQRTVQARLTDTIGDFRQLHFEKELSENKTIRFIFHGKSLGNDRCTLESCNVKRNSVIHCLVTPSLTPRHTEEIGANSTVQSTNINSGNRLDISFELVLYLSVIIAFAVLWYLFFNYGQALLYPCLMSILGGGFFLFAMYLAIYRVVHIRTAQRTA